MTAIRFLIRFAAAFAVVLAAACDSGSTTSGSAPPTVPPSGVPPESGAPKSAPDLSDPDALRREMEDRSREGDVVCRKLIEAFRSHVYDPVRDDGLQSAEGSVHVRVIGSTGEIREGSFEIEFRADRPPTRQTITSPADDADALPANSHQLVQRFASTGFRGGYFSVITHLPKTFLTLFEPSDGKWGVHCPVDGLEISTSYVFDDKNIITTRGTVTENARQVETMEWENPQGRYLLKAIRVTGFPTETTWEYDDTGHGVGLPSLIVVKRGDSSVELMFTYRNVRVDRSAQILPATPK